MTLPLVSVEGVGKTRGDSFRAYPPLSALVIFFLCIPAILHLPLSEGLEQALNDKGGGGGGGGAPCYLIYKSLMLMLKKDTKGQYEQLKQNKIL